MGTNCSNACCGKTVPCYPCYWGHLFSQFQDLLTLCGWWIMTLEFEGRECSHYQHTPLQTVHNHNKWIVYYCNSGGQSDYTFHKCSRQVLVGDGACDTFHNWTGDPLASDEYPHTSHKSVLDSHQEEHSRKIHTGWLTWDSVPHKRNRILDSIFFI